MKRQKDSPPGSASLRLPPSGGRDSLRGVGFSGGLGAAPPVIWLGEPVASPARNNPLRESGLKGQLSVLTARVSGFLRQDDQRQRRGAFRASRNTLRVRIDSFEGNHLRLVLFDGLFSCLDAISKAASKAEGRTDHVRVGSA
uniref:Uncharacterized protein n=1 Tax=uncultured prokaryote TaxID=198431 RepID=A0A0H5PVJ9_9ZZZZ|nr:hypothetical protein [uncultured prokaryote]